MRSLPNRVITRNKNLQQAVSSSAPSSQSETPSHKRLLSIHFGVAFGPPLGQLNLLSEKRREKLCRYSLRIEYSNQKLG
jgi:hypothetical protein